MPTTTELIAKLKAQWANYAVTEVAEAIHADNQRLAERVEALEAATRQLETLRRADKHDITRLREFVIHNADRLAALEAASKPQDVREQAELDKKLSAFIEENIRLRKEIHDLRVMNQMHVDHANGDYWAWQNDEYDHLESLVCPVLIAADDLREIVVKRQPQPSPTPPAEPSEAESIVSEITDPIIKSMREDIAKIDVSAYKTPTDAEYAVIGQAWGKEHGKHPYGREWGAIGNATGDDVSPWRLPKEVYGALTGHNRELYGVKRFGDIGDKESAWISLGRAVYKLGWRMPVAEQVRKPIDDDSGIGLAEFPYVVHQICMECGNEFGDCEHLMPSVEQATQPAIDVSALVAMCEKWKLWAEECCDTDLAMMVRNHAAELLAVIGKEKT